MSRSTNRNQSPVPRDPQNHSGSGSSQSDQQPYISHQPDYNYGAPQQQHSRGNNTNPSAKAPEESQGGAGFFTQLTATMRRQLIQKRRIWISWLFEIFLPAVFMVGLLAIALASGTTDYAPQNFIQADGPIKMPSLIADTYLCYDKDNTNTHQDLKDLLKECRDMTKVFKVPLSREVPIEGLCVNGSVEVVFPIADSYLRGTADVLIPNFDEYVLFKWAMVSVLPAPDNIFMERIGQARQPGKVYLTPDSTETQAFHTYMMNTHKMYKHVFGRFFPSRQAAEPFIKSLDNEGDVWAMYEIGTVNDMRIDYNLHMNISAINMLQAGPRNEFAIGLGTKEHARYLISGALTLQKTINDYYMTEIVQYTDTDIVPTGVDTKLSIAPMPLLDYIDNEFLVVAGDMAPFLLVLSYLYPVSQLAKRLVEEKEQRLREGTMIMGLTKAAFFSSWLLIYYAQMVVTATAMAVIMKLGITTQTNFFIIWVSFLLYSFATVNMSALLSTFFNKSKMAALLVPLLYFVFAIPAFAIPETVSAGAFHVLSIFCPMPFAVSLKLMYKHEIKRGLGWNGAINKKDVPYNYALSLMWYIFDFIIYLLLTVYFDNVLPKDWGTTLHPCYCCCCCCKKKRGEDTSEDGLRSGAYHQADTIDNPKNHMDKINEYSVLQNYPEANRQSSVHINNLRKEFPGAHGKVNVAVDGMELRLFPDQITVFLGHNGAGKTTVMNMMTGMMSPTAGDVSIYGNSILTNMQAIRRDIGFCPQHNILWDDLTCLEHLQYFARLKGYNGAAVDEEAEELLRKVDLLDKKDVFSKNLSGGQKRKLSVAIAFMGRARLVLLDEPTAGMDVAARRHTWDVLKDMAKGRTIVLTTHFMDEADLLGSRIAIMSKGALHSYGTPMFLKNNLGSGYVMRVASPTTINDTKPIMSYLQQVIPKAAVKEAKGQELSIALPKDDLRQFPAAIRAMEDPNAKQQLGIASVSVSVSSLEEVFLSIAEHEDVEGKTADKIAEDEAHHRQAFEALERVYVRLQKQQRQAQNGVQEDGHDDVEMGAKKKPTMGATGGFCRQLTGMFMKRVNHGRRDYCALCLQIIAPLICILIAMGLSEINAPDTERFAWDNSLYEDDDVDQTTAADFCAPIDNYFDSDFVEVKKTSYQSAYRFSQFLMDDYNNNGDRERMVAFSCAAIADDSHVLFANATGLATSAQAANQFYRAKHRAFMSDASATINAAQWPFPFSDRQNTQIDSIKAVLMALFILIPFTFVPSTYVAFVVRERECKSKHLQFVSGASYSAYWLANFLFDLISYILTVIIAFIIFGIFDQEWIIGSTQSALGAVVLFLLYGISAIGFAYLVSFLFDNHSTAQTVVMMVNFLIGFLLVLLMYFLREIESTESAAEVLVYFFRVAPAFALGDGLFQMVMANTLAAVNGDKSPFDMDVCGWCMLYMGLLSAAFLAITMYIDHPSRAKRQEMLSFKGESKKAPTVFDEDEDVLRERRAVEDGDRPDDVVQVTGLRKEFELPNGKTKVAVQNITFGVKPGEVFGFLGTNGAGKTTTMSMLTTEIVPTCGRGHIGGFDVVRESEKTRRLIGYCPQFDAIMDLLTPVEHLKLFAALRGIDVLATNEVIDALIDSCALQKYRDIPAGSLSGGNKRKLSVAMSLIGGPSIVFLDEPSAGMDPHARRQLWDVIVFVAKHSSVVLTTHHLEEVDVLAHRVGIMDQGLMRCLGSLEHLKLKFGNGFELTVQVADGQQSKATEFVESTYPTAVLVEARNQRILYTLPFDSTDLASLFETIQRATDEGITGIIDYTVQQTSLEQVFMRISELSGAEGEDPLHDVPAGGEDAMSPIHQTDAVHRRQTTDLYASSVFGRARTGEMEEVDVDATA